LGRGRRRRRIHMGLLVGKPERKRSLGMSRRLWVDNIKVDLVEIGWGGMDWIVLNQDRDHWRTLVNTGVNVHVPENVGKFLSGCTSGGLSRRVQFHGVRYFSLPYLLHVMPI
jgi:hypothetical protein